MKNTKTHTHKKKHTHKNTHTHTQHSRECVLCCGTGRLVWYPHQWQLLALQTLWDTSHTDRSLCSNRTRATEHSLSPLPTVRPCKDRCQIAILIPKKKTYNVIRKTD